MEALLRFGEANSLCFGVEYVDAALLTIPVNLQIRAGTVEEAVHSILGKQRPFAVERRDGVVKITLPQSESVKGIFDYVLPNLEVRRGSVQEISNVLRMSLVASLNPEITGFAGHYFPGDLKDEAGPFRERNRPLRHLLDAILARSRGGAWIARIGWNLRGNLKLPEATRRVDYC